MRGVEDITLLFIATKVSMELRPGALELTNQGNAKKMPHARTHAGSQTPVTQYIVTMKRFAHLFSVLYFPFLCAHV